MTATRPRVLMVDDQAELVWSVSHHLERHRPDLAFEGFNEPEPALTKIRFDPPHVLVTDVRMPGMSGLELLLAAREVAPQLPVVVITAYGSAEVRDEVAARRQVQYIEKPFTMSAFLDAIDRALARRSGFSGAISLPMLPDLIQLYALAQTSGTLRIRQDEEEGAIWFQEGDIAHAICGDRSGAEAVYHLLTWEGGSFAMEPGEHAPERSILTGWQEILVEGCRLLDERARAASEPDVPTVGRADSDGWESLAAALQAARPDSLVLRFRLGEADDDPEAADWAAAAEAMAADAQRVVGESRTAVVEGVSRDLGVALMWDAGTTTLLVLAEGIGVGPHGVQRFRAAAVRWREACERWLREQRERRADGQDR